MRTHKCPHCKKDCDCLSWLDDDEWEGMVFDDLKEFDCIHYERDECDVDEKEINYETKDDRI